MSGGRPQISVVIPTLEAERTLVPALASLVPAAVAGVVREVIVADGGSRDGTRDIAEEAGCRLLEAPRGRGTQLKAGGEAARGDWLLFLHADTVLAEGWWREAATFMAREQSGGQARAAAFTFVLADEGVRPRMLERLVALRCALFALPYGDQALLVPRTLYRALGGYRELPLMEDVELVRRIGRRRLVMLRSAALTSAERYRRDGYLRRSVRNLFCLALYGLGVSPQRIRSLYG